MLRGTQHQRQLSGQATIRPVLKRARRDITASASEAKNSTATETPKARDANGDKADPSEHRPTDRVEAINPLQPDDEKLKRAVNSAKAHTHEHAVKQQLSPLTSQDEVDLSAPPGVELEGLIVNILERVAKPDEPDIPEAFGFTLSNDAIHEFDLAHPPPGREPTPAFIKVAYDVLLFFVDRVYEGKAIERFWFLETVARMPYFSYTTCLHLYETLGWWRTGGLRVIHFAEEWNELHHLLIMEALGGDRRWQDRFLGQHAAVFYYWALVVCFLLAPKWSYKFSEMLETHAVSTYRQFIIENEETLKQLPAPRIAQQYYLSDDPYLYNMDSALCRGPVEGEPRRPPCDNLHDVFVNILEDEWEHVKTMVMCQDYDLLETMKVTQTQFMSSDVIGRRELWNRWAKDINDMDLMIELRKW